MKDIPGFEGRFAATEGGEIFSLSRLVFGGKKPYQIPLRTLTQEKTKDGYLRVGLTVNNRQVKHSVSRLVLMTFRPDESSDTLEANHINGITTDNRLCNLEWLTRSENNIHAYKQLNRKTQKYWTGKLGPDHSKSKTAIGMDECGNIVAQFTPISSCRIRGFSASKISNAATKGMLYKSIRWVTF